MIWFKCVDELVWVVSPFFQEGTIAEFRPKCNLVCHECTFVLEKIVVSSPSELAFEVIQLFLPEKKHGFEIVISSIAGLGSETSNLSKRIFPTTQEDSLYWFKLK